MHISDTRGRVLKSFLKFTAAFAIALVLGLGSSYAALWLEARSGGASLSGENPYARAAYAARDLLPKGPQP
jgi:hypothetical protein